MLEAVFRGWWENQMCVTQPLKTQKTLDTVEPCMICLNGDKARFRSYISTDVLLSTADMFYVEYFGFKFPRCCCFFGRGAVFAPLLEAYVFTLGWSCLKGSNFSGFCCPVSDLCSLLVPVCLSGCDLRATVQESTYTVTRFPQWKGTLDFWRRC